MNPSLLGVRLWARPVVGPNTPTQDAEVGKSRCDGIVTRHRPRTCRDDGPS